MRRVKATYRHKFKICRLKVVSQTDPYCVPPIRPPLTQVMSNTMRPAEQASTNTDVQGGRAPQESLRSRSPPKSAMAKMRTALMWASMRSGADRSATIRGAKSTNASVVTRRAWKGQLASTLQENNIQKGVISSFYPREQPTSLQSLSRVHLSYRTSCKLCRSGVHHSSSILSMPT